VTAGKSVGQDIQEGKLTLPILYACESNPELATLVRAKLGERAVSPADARAILSATIAAGGVDRARAKARDLVASAVAELEVLPASAYRSALTELAALSVDRKF